MRWRSSSASRRGHFDRGQRFEPRQARLSAIRAAFAPIPVDDAVALAYGEVIATARKVGRTTKATDLLMIATAAATGRVLWTADDSRRALAKEVGAAVR